MSREDRPAQGLADAEGGLSWGWSAEHSLSHSDFTELAKRLAVASRPFSCSRITRVRRSAGVAWFSFGALKPHVGIHDGEAVGLLGEGGVEAFAVHGATVEQLVADTLVERRFYLLLVRVFSIVALLLATVGVFGAIRFATSLGSTISKVRAMAGQTPGGVRRRE